MSAGRQLLYCCFYQTKKRNIFSRRAGQDGQIRSMRIYQQRHARMFERLRCRRATIGYYSVFERSVGRKTRQNIRLEPRSDSIRTDKALRCSAVSSAKADDPVPHGGPVRQPASPLDPSPAERAGRVARRERKRTACRVGEQEKTPTLASLRFGLPSPLLAR